MTWLRVVQALESVGEQALADRLKELYSGEEPLEDMPAYSECVCVCVCVCVLCVDLILYFCL